MTSLKGNKKTFKAKGEGEEGWGRTQTDPACNLQPWQPHKHLLFLQHTPISPQTLSSEHGKLKRAGQDFLVFLTLCFSFCSNPYFLIFPPLFSFSHQEDGAALKRRSCIILLLEETVVKLSAALQMYSVIKSCVFPPTEERSLAKTIWGMEYWSQAVVGISSVGEPSSLYP